MAVRAPKAYWKLDEASGNAIDEVSGLSAVNTNATYAAAKLNNGTTYNGTTAFHTVSDNTAIKPANAISFGGWVYINSRATSYQMLIAKGENAGDTRSYELRQYLTTGQMEVQMRAGAAYILFRSTTAIPLNTWTHIIATRTGTTNAMYINGVAETLATNVTQAADLAYSTDALWFGQRNGGLRFNGSLDEIGIWDVALSASEVSELYNSGAGLAYRSFVPLTFKSATVNASLVPSTQTSFPSYVDLSRIGITTLAEAQSVRVYADSAKTTEWAREIVSATEMHVKVPSLTSTVTMYVDWDGVRADYAVTDTFGRNAVWVDYSMVLHMQSSSVDSTSNGLNGTDTSMAYNSTAGFTENGADYSSATAVTKHNYDMPNSYTHSFWVYINSTASGNAIMSKDLVTSNRYLIYHYVYPDQYMQFFAWNSGNSLKYINTANNQVPVFTWVKIDVVWDSTGNTTYYVNGVVGTTNNNVATGGSAGNSTAYDFWFAARQNGGGSYQNEYLDNIHFSSVARSANWITTEYNNQSNESSFWGTWTTVGGGGGVTFVPHVTAVV